MSIVLALLLVFYLSSLFFYPSIPVCTVWLGVL